MYYNVYALCWLKCYILQKVNCSFSSVNRIFVVMGWIWVSYFNGSAILQSQLAIDQQTMIIEIHIPPILCGGRWSLTWNIIGTQIIPLLVIVIIDLNLTNECSFEDTISTNFSDRWNVTYLNQKYISALFNRIVAFLPFRKNWTLKTNHLLERETTEKRYGRKMVSLAVNRWNMKICVKVITQQILLLQIRIWETYKKPKTRKLAKLFKEHRRMLSPRRLIHASLIRSQYHFSRWYEST